ncbi:hypothetical protein C0995_005544 [Termitomyces sp. Mi166|nr:hypothetical protein C0995_005544 [Termitomyces sp. Mi166\
MLSLYCLPRRILKSFGAVYPRQSHTIALTKPIRGRSIQRRFRCRTLQPRLLEPSDLLDLSGCDRPYIQIDSQGGESVRLRYHKTCDDPIPFPLNTLGFLYYHHDPTTPLSSGEIRFRITPRNDLTNFDEGQDLITPNYIPWSLSLFQLTNLGFAPLKDLLITEGLVEEALIQSMVGKNFRGHKRPLHYLEQPFVMKLQSGNFMFNVFDGETVAQHLMYDRSNKTGHILVRFELSTLPEHAHSCIVVLRVLKILEAIKVMIPGYDMYLPMPHEGQLLESRNKDHRTKSPFTINLDKPSGIWKNLNLLVKK